MAVPVELPDGSVIVPAALAGPVRRILIRDLAQHIRTDGGAPTTAVRQLVYALARAEHHAQADTDGSDTGTPPPAPATVEISTTAAAVVLGCSESYVRRLCRSGRLHGRRAGRRTWLIDRASLDAWRYRTESTVTRPATLAHALDAALTAHSQAGDAARTERNNAHGWAGIAELDDAVERAKADPAYLATLRPHERDLIQLRIANLSARTTTTEEGTK